MKIYCGIVTYNPKIDILKENIKSVYAQVEKIIIIDNASENLKEIEENIINDSKVHLIANNENFGIATALNQIVAFALNDNVKWVLTLDQDSVVPDNYISSFDEYMNEDVGILCPRVYNIEKDSEDLPHKGSSKIIEVAKCITSGSLLNVTAWRAVDGFEEKLFIDNVDFEFCFRIRKAGYKILKNQEITIEHSLGERKNVEFCFFKKTISSHSAFRVYYICRNKLYCDYKAYNRATLRSFASILKILWNIIMWEDEKKDKLRCAVEGIRDSVVLIKDYKINSGNR